MQIGDDPGLATTINHADGQTTLVLPSEQQADERDKEAEWDGEVAQSFPEGIRSAKERLPHIKALKGDANYSPARAFARVKFDPEPQYTTDAYVSSCITNNGFNADEGRISDLESKLGAGLIEEVIAVAEGEHNLVDTMVKSKV
jgi:NADH dehydrogenase (ubiquinone) 1 alpha subcomplex subunit 5